MSITTTNLSWHAIYVRDRYEKKVTDVLSRRNIEAFCPYNNKPRTERKKSSVEPLFNSLVFVRIQPEQAKMVTNISGVINFAHWLGSPVKIREEEINAIKLMVETQEPLKLQKIKVDASAPVELTHKRIVEKDGKLVQVLHVPYKASIPSIGYCVQTVSDGKTIIEVAGSTTYDDSGKQVFLERLSKEVG